MKFLKYFLLWFFILSLFFALAMGIAFLIVYLLSFEWGIWVFIILLIAGIAAYLAWNKETI